MIKFCIEEAQSDINGKHSSTIYGYWKSEEEALNAARKKYLEEESHLEWKEAYNGLGDVFFSRSNIAYIYKACVREYKPKVIVINEW